MKKAIIGIFGVLTIAVFGGLLVVASNVSTNTREPKKVASTETLASTTEESSAKLEIFSEGVDFKLKDSDNFTIAENNQGIFEGTIIRTNATGRAQVVFTNGTVTRIDSKSEIKISSLTENPFTTKIKLESGRVWNRISKLFGKESYQTETETTVATVRGTSYGHGILANGDNKITTTKGKVEGECKNDSQKASIEKDNKGILSCKENVGTKLSKVDAKDQDEWFKFNQEEDKKLNDRFGKERYDDEDNVLGITTATNTIPTSFASPILIDCQGVDGKITKQTKETCDAVKKFWDTHPPAPEDPAGDLPKSDPATINPSVTQVEGICTDFSFCDSIKIKIIGTKLIGVARVTAISLGPESQGQTADATSIFTESESTVFAEFNEGLNIGEYKVQMALSDGTILTSPNTFTTTFTASEQVFLFKSL